MTEEMKEEDLFAGLPDNEEKQEDKKEPEKPEEKPEDKDEEESKISEVLISKDKAIRDERRRRKEAEERLKALEDKFSGIDPEAITKKVKEELVTEGYDKGVVEKIRSTPGLSKQAAKLIYDTVKSLPPQRDASVAVELAISYVKEQQRLGATMGNETIVTNQGSFLADETSAPSDIPESQLRQAKELTAKLGGSYALNEEDIKKYRNNPTL